MKFISFWFEGNEAWGKIDSPEEWKRVLNIYSVSDVSSIDLMRMAYATIETEEVENGDKKVPDRYLPNFGLYINSQMTLEDWAKKNNMYDVLV